MHSFILDTDIGTDVDDALALAFAACLPTLRLEAVTTVHADAPLRARIARRLLALAGRGEVPVVPGASLPLGPPTPDPFHWHARLWGHEGKGFLTAGELVPTADLRVTEEDAARFIVERAAARPGELSVIAVGPLTNLARALRIEPRLAEWVPRLTLMGGLVHDGASPWPPVLETNLNADPEAARIVFASGIPLTVVPIDVTTQVFLGPEHRAEVRSWDTPLAVALAGLMEQMREGFVDFSDLMGLPPDIFKGRTFMHDPLAIAAAVGSPFVTTRRLRLRLEVRERVLRTIPADSSGTEAAVCVAVDAPAFVDWWLDTVRRFGGEADHRSGGQQLGKEHA